MVSSTRADVLPPPPLPCLVPLVSPLANLKLLRRFFDTNPEYVDKTFLSIKGGGIQGKEQVRLCLLVSSSAERDTRPDPPWLS